MPISGSSEPVLQLLDHVLLIAPTISQLNDFRGAEILTCGDVEEITESHRKAPTRLSSCLLST